MWKLANIGTSMSVHIVECTIYLFNRLNEMEFHKTTTNPIRCKNSSLYKLNKT